MPPSPVRPIEDYPTLGRQLFTFGLPITEITLRLPYSLERAQQRLSQFVDTGIVHISGRGLFADRRRYTVKMNGTDFVIQGPFGDRKWSLLTRGRLRVDPIGSALDLTMRLGYGSLIVVISLVSAIVLIGGAVLITQGLPWTLLLCLMVPASFLYTIVLINAKFEAEMLKDLLYISLSDEV
jgi:hypothetical protein